MLIISCCDKSRKKGSVNGIWIPEVVDWKEGSFDTYYIKDDTVVIISSEQKKIKDSIYFRTEPGFNVAKGVLRPIAEGKYLLPHKSLYRFIKLKGANADGTFTDTVSVVSLKGTPVRLNINGINFIQGRLYTKESRESIISIVTEMVPDMEKHPEKFN
ncbi:MAG TPA: hypothetical protein VL727_15205 [Puia sp.]|nr:hypothetical protein [Puia sp.]